MSKNPYNSLNDIHSIIANNVPESVTLEYKGSDILAPKNVNTLCKAITALANSVGGQFVIGIESQGGKPVRLDGGVSGPSKRDWIYTIINAGTFPPVESVEVIELLDADGTYYVIDVLASPYAPHQSNDRRYYKRRGSHSEPMEHYEIEDVRNRPKGTFAPLRIALFTQDQLAFLHIRNDHASDNLKNINIRVDSNFEFEREGIQSLQSRGLRELRPQVERYFILDTVPTMLQKNPEAELHISVIYEFRESQLKDSASFYLADLMNSAIVQSPTVNAIRGLADKIKNMSDHLERLRRDFEGLTRIADGTGLRLSQRTLRALKEAGQFFDPYEFDWDGYKIILEISNDDALALHHIFGTISPTEIKRKQYNELSPDLRAKFEKHFRVEFD